jgi:hypothetical protein
VEHGERAKIITGQQIIAVPVNNKQRLIGEKS